MSSINILLHLLVPTFCLNKLIVYITRKLQVSRTSQSVISAFKLYQHVHILCILYNNCHRSILIPLLILSAIICLCIPVFVSATRLNQLDFAAIVIFSNLAGICFSLILGCLSFAANTNKQSKSIMLCFKRILIQADVDSCLGSSKVLKKTVRSLYLLKIRFLHSNYLDRVTHLVFL